MINGQTGRAHWSLVHAYVNVVTWPPTPSDGAYCNALLFAHWSVYQKLSHISFVKSLCTRLYVLTTPANSLTVYTWCGNA